MDNVKTDENQELNEVEVHAWYDKQIALAEKRAMLAKLQCDAVEAEAKRIQYAIMIAQMRMQEQDEKKGQDLVTEEEGE